MEKKRRRWTMGLAVLGGIILSQGIKAAYPSTSTWLPGILVAVALVVGLVLVVDKAGEKIKPQD